MITRDNYEIYFIDYFDGNLSDADISCLFDFLDNNEDLRQEFLSFEEMNVSIAVDTDFNFKTKNELKQIESSSIFNDELFVTFDI